MYSQKTIQNLKPDWYLQLSKKEKIKEQEFLKSQRSEMWNQKPEPIKKGSKLSAKETRKNITKDKSYVVISYFATLVTTIYCSQWHEFIVLKNDNGYSVKMNLNNFNKLEKPQP